MFKFTLHLLLCTAVFSMHTPDLFRGCVESSGKPPAPSMCVMVPRMQIRTRWMYYSMFAEAVLQEPSNQPGQKFLNAVYNFTRAAVKQRTHKAAGATLRLEFTTAQSDCFDLLDYTAKNCQPVNAKVNGLCQARFFVFSGGFVLERSWCKHSG